MRLNRVNERRCNANNPLLLIAVGAIVIILLIIVGYFLFGTGSEEPSSQIVTEPDNSETANPDESATVIPRSLEPTLKPTRIPTAVPTPAFFGMMTQSIPSLPTSLATCSGAAPPNAITECSATSCPFSTV